MKITTGNENLEKSKKCFINFRNLQRKHLKRLQLDPNKSSVKHTIVKVSKVLTEAPKNSKKCQVTLKRRLVRHTVALAEKKKNPYYMEVGDIAHWLRVLTHTS